MSRVKPGLSPLGSRSRGSRAATLPNAPSRIKVRQGETMKTSLILRIGIACAVALSLMTSSAANAGGAGSGYSWTEIIVPHIGPLGLVIGINDNDQVAVNNAD